MTDDVRLRWAQFYWHAWRDDRGLQECSLIAKGLWIEMLTLMGGDEVYGHLHGPNGGPMTVQQLARRTYSTIDEVQRALDELESNGVFSRNEQGVIYNRRMVRDGDQYARFAEAGKRGGRPPNNPPLTPVKTPLKGGNKAPSKQTPKPPPNHTETDTDTEADAESICDVSSVESHSEDARPRARQRPTPRKGAAAARSAPPKPNKNPDLIPSGRYEWPEILGICREDKCWWPDEFGPAPGEPGCFVPDKFLEPGDGDGWVERATEE